MGYADLGCFGSEIRTPGIDSLAANGVTYTNFYNAGRCCPTRASLLTGVYPTQAGIGLMLWDLELPTYQGQLSEEVMTIADVLKMDDYGTYMSGKWHLGEEPDNWPLQHGFDKYFGLISGASSYFEVTDGKQMAYNNETFHPADSNFYMTRAITDSAVSFIDEHLNTSDAPFFLMMNYTSPHWPLHIPENYSDGYYEQLYMQGWDSIRAKRLEGMTEKGIIGQDVALSERPATVPAWEEVDNKEAHAQRMAVYANMIQYMDDDIKLFTAWLKIKGVFDNTLIIFLSDNGGSMETEVCPACSNPGAAIGSRRSFDSYREPWANVSDVPFRLYKEYMHEGGIRTPMIVSWPNAGMDDGSIDPTRGHVIDILPTLMNATQFGMNPPYDPYKMQRLEGISLFSTGTYGIDNRTQLFWEHKGNAAVHGEYYKLVSSYPGGWELYDMELDPTEGNNLADSLPVVVENMAKDYDEWATRTGVLPREEAMRRKREILEREQ